LGTRGEGNEGNEGKRSPAFVDADLLACPAISMVSFLVFAKYGVTCFLGRC
jgi:hypothetical protein